MDKADPDGYFIYLLTCSDEVFEADIASMRLARESAMRDEQGRPTGISVTRENPGDVSEREQRRLGIYSAGDQRPR